MTFYNTIQENPNQLAKSESKAKTQEANIMNCFKQYERPLSPSMVLSISGLNCPITSIRRAMTNLSDDGKLEKTKDFGDCILKSTIDWFHWVDITEKDL